MRRVLITGMSGTGKSTLIAEFAALGYKAVDTDDGWCEPLPDGRQQWREDAIDVLLATEDTDVLFMAGCEENQVKFHAQFDHIILLSAPLEVLTQRLATRTNNPFGKSAEEFRRFQADLQQVEPRLRAVADYEIDTTMALSEVVRAILKAVDVRPPAGPGCSLPTRTWLGPRRHNHLPRIARAPSGGPATVVSVWLRARGVRSVAGADRNSGPASARRLGRRR